MYINSSNNPEDGTSDLGLAATLMSLGFKLTGVDRSNPRKARFLFEHIDDFQLISDRYWSRSVEVDAYTINENSKLLKGRIYAG